MPANVSSLGRIRTMSQDIEEARRKQHGQLKQPSPMEHYEGEDMLGQLKKPTVLTPQTPAAAKAPAPTQPLAPRPFIPAPPVPSRPTRSEALPATPFAPPLRPMPPALPKAERPLPAPGIAPKLGDFALRPPAQKPTLSEILPPLQAVRPAAPAIQPEKPAMPAAPSPKSFIPVEEEELEQMFRARGATAVPIAPRIAALPVKPTVPPAIQKPAYVPVPPPTSQAVPPKTSTAAEKPLPPPFAAMQPAKTIAPAPTARAQVFGAAPPLNLPGAEKEKAGPLAPVVPLAVPQRESGLKTPEEILGLPSMLTPPPARPMPQPQMAVPQEPLAATPLSPVGKFPHVENLPYEESPRRRSNILQFIAILLGVLIIGGGIGGFTYWKVYLQGSAPGIPGTPPAPVTPGTPTPFFSTSQQQTIELQKGNEAFLVEQLRALEHSAQPAKTITYLPVKKLTDNSYAQTKDLLGLLNIQLPQTLIDSLDPAPMLYLYTPDEEEKEKCKETNNFDVSCYSSRLGMVFKILPGRETVVQNTISDQEQNLVQLFTPIILGSPLFDQATNWKTANYTGFTVSYPGGVIVRYNNMPISPTGLNYAVVNGYLLIATSKNSTYFALDQLVNAAAK